MAVFSYAGTAYELEDRLLAHLKIAITAKLRLGEGFLLSWTVPPGQGAGRTSVWLSPGIPLGFRFGGSKPPALSREWLEALERSSHGIRGMVAMSEGEAARYLEAAGRAAAP